MIIGPSYSPNKVEAHPFRLQRASKVWTPPRTPFQLQLQPQPPPARRSSGMADDGKAREWEKEEKEEEEDVVCLDPSFFVDRRWGALLFTFRVTLMTDLCRTASTTCWWIDFFFLSRFCCWVRRFRQLRDGDLHFRLPSAQPPLPPRRFRLLLLGFLLLVILSC